MPQPVSNTLTVVSGSLLANKISYVVDGQQRNYRGGYGGLSWMSEAEATNNVIFIGNTSTIGRGPADKPLFYPAYNTSQANIVYAANTLPGSPRNFTTSASAYNWAVTNNFFINNSDNPIPRIDADGLVLYLDANQPSSYPQTGTTWYDLSGRNNNGTLINGPTFNNGGYITFDGVDDYCSFPVNTFNSGAPQQGTFYIRMKFPTLNTVSSTILFYDGGLSANLIYLYRNANFSLNGYSWLIYYNRTDSQVDALLPQLPYLPNTWYDTAFTFNSSGEYRVYVNGELKSLENASLFSSWRRTGTNSPFLDPASLAGTGSIQLLQWYDRPLTLTEIKQNYFQSNIITDGLVFMTDANNLVSYPRSGTSIYNLTSSISTVTGSLINGPTYGVENGGSIVFDGVDDYIDFNNLAGTLISNPSLNSNIISFSCWVLVSNPGSYYIISSGGQTSSTGVAFSYQNGSPFVSIQGTNFSVSVSISTSDFPLNTWINFAFVGNGSNLTVYKNGVYLNVGSYGVTVLSDTQTILSLGRPNNFTGLTLGGKLAQVMFYSKALTPSEVQQNYQATKDKFQGQQIITNGLVLNLDSANKDSYPGTGTTWYDLSGNGNHGTINSGEFVPNSFGGYLGNLNNQSNFFYISIPNSTSISNTLSVTTGGWTIEEIIWTNSTDYPEADAGSVFSDPAYGPGATGFDWNHGFGISQFRFGQSSNSATGYEDDIVISSIPSQYAQFNTWRIRTMIWDRSNNTVSLYINGVYIGGGNTPNTAGQAIYDGDGGSIGTLYGWKFYGRRGAFKIWNRVLSQSEITQNYNAQKTRFGL